MITVRAARDADRRSILELFEAVFGARSAERSARLWEWQWQLDPRLERPGYRGVVAEWQGRIVGNVGYVPAGLHAGGQPIVASWGINVVIHWGWVRQALRAQRRSGRGERGALGGSSDLSRGLAAALINHASNDPIQLGKHISGAMLAVTENIGFVPVETSGSWGRQLSLTPRVRRLVGPLLAPLVAWPGNRLLPAIVRVSLPVRAWDGEFDSRFDDLWWSVAAGYERIGRRDAATLNWRFRRHPFNRYRVLVLERMDGSGLRGYVVTTMVPRGRFLQGRIIDLLTARDDREAVQALLSAALMALREAGAAAVDCYASHDALIGPLQALGFGPRQKLHRIVVRGLPASGLYVTELDGDGG